MLKQKQSYEIGNILANSYSGKGMAEQWKVI